MRVHTDIHNLVGERPVTAAVSNYRPTTPAPVKRFTRAEIRAYIKARGKA
jgi:hypothetical protein